MRYCTHASTCAGWGACSQAVCVVHVVLVRSFMVRHGVVLAAALLEAVVFVVVELQTSP